MEKEMAEEILRHAPVDGILLTGAANMRYVSGFTGEGYVYLSGKQSLIVTDSRYTVAAALECPGYQIVQWDKKGTMNRLPQLSEMMVSANWVLRTKR